MYEFEYENNAPNFSVVLPAKCNARCAFCDSKQNINKISETKFIRELQKVVDALPPIFTQVSVTGGEPTKFRRLPQVLQILRKRFPKIVINTNGYKLTPESIKLVDHINLSRHACLDYDNYLLMRTETVPTLAAIESLCDVANSFGVDVTINCVVPTDYNDALEVRDFVEFVKRVGASALTFRKIHSDLTQLPVVATIGNTLIDSTECPVCKTESMLVNGIPVVFKYSPTEPSDTLEDTVYELVMQPTGIVTIDWAGKITAASIERASSRADDSYISLRNPNGCGMGYRPFC